MQPKLFTPTSLSVTEITRYLRELLESEPILRDLWVQGEVSNLARPPSGHIYFTLKDESAALRCVMWKTSALRLRVPLQNGLAIEVHGAISLYERDGAYQLYADAIRPVGEGALFQQFMRLKARLEAEGLFDAERKRPIPARPRGIGIVTSPTGAALQDMLHTLQRRYPLVEVVVAPAQVQGTEAPPTLVAALHALNRIPGVDVIIIARGGGSVEDLWAFNDERVVRAVVDSAIPVISGVGHETDFTLTDFAADLRAPTPTSAAEQATPDIQELVLGLQTMLERLVGALQYRLETHRTRLEQLDYRLARLSPLRRVPEERQHLDDLSARLGRTLSHNLQLQRSRLTGYDNRLAALNPLAVLRRGYAVVQGADGRLVQSVAQVSPAEMLNVHLADGQINVEVKQIISNPGRGS